MKDRRRRGVEHYSVGRELMSVRSTGYDDGREHRRQQRTMASLPGIGPLNLARADPLNLARADLASPATASTSI